MNLFYLSLLVKPVHPRIFNIETDTKNHNNPIYTASLDRIDSSKGYEIGNVQFISTAINYMKNTMSHEDTLKLCKIIAEKYSGDGGIR